jgi:hypothetical protein
MTVRTSMGYIISFVRDLIGDPAGADQDYTDQQIQDRLDLNRMDISFGEIEAVFTYSTIGRSEWHDFIAPVGFWETDVYLQTSAGAIQTPDDPNYMLGRFHFDAQLTQDILFLTGKAYNVYGAAGHLVTAQASAVRGSFNSFTADGLTVQRVTRLADLRQQASDLISMGWGWGWPGETLGSTQIRLVRNDIRG